MTALNIRYSLVGKGKHAAREELLMILELAWIALWMLAQTTSYVACLPDRTGVSS